MDNYNYGIIGNCSSAALVSTDCSIDWLCLPNFDSPSLFARILDQADGGHFKISGYEQHDSHQEYLRLTPILRTVVHTAQGSYQVNDYMPRYRDSRGEYQCPSEVHRMIRVLSGNPKIRIDFAPRPNYALGAPEFRPTSDYIKVTSTKGPYNSYYLYSNLDFDKILSGEEIEPEPVSYFVLSYHEKLEQINCDRIYLAYQRTKSYWLEWMQRSHYTGRFAEEFQRSSITLKLLMYQRTGAVIAAPTTSLPEIIGQERNWDYRFCWVRDAAMIVDTYVRIGHIQTADGFINFLLNRMQLKHEDIGVMYGINGEEKLDEVILDHLPGYKDSKPVRIGNAAYLQKQNDLYGELIETIYTYFFINRRASFQVNEEIWTMVRSLVNRVRECWREKDSGIWERREAMQHYTHSKLMAWVAMDRACKIARFIRKPEYVNGWAQLAEDIKVDILKNAWNEDLKCFTMYYGSELYDASNLLMLHYGFLSPDDPRMISTVEEHYKHLVKNGFTFRYTSDDEFGTPENAFIVCSFWMINALYLIGREDEARQMFDHVRSCANHLGLFSEDVDITTKRLTGNFPQGYSHLAYIQTALLLETDYNWSDAYALKPNN
ncbi:MAG: glycoside hydrolase family 15 protein [Candidatus Omnitrophica bacterium]|nr:glycoside hydrolase family 15 protein [Candidatus Omnitrophota bacterium]